MPPLPVIEDVYRVALNWSHGTSGSAANVLHFLETSGTGNATTINQTIEASVEPNMWAPCSENASVESMDITKLDGFSATETFATSGANWTGGAASAGVPAVATVVKLSTALRGPSFRGRVFLPFVGESVQDEGMLTPSVRTSCNVGWSDFQLALIATTNTPLVVASYLLASAADVTNLFVDGILATQRRRQSRLRS